jgi:hypothetical protein
MCGTIYCPKCRRVREGTRHHVLPKRFFGDSPHAPILYLCRDCHDLIEKEIPLHYKLEREDYFQLTAEFLEQSYSNVIPFRRRRKKHEMQSLQDVDL